MAGFESFIAEELRSVGISKNTFTNRESERNYTDLKDMPYCETASYPDFHTNVTSQALVAWSRHERNAEIGLPPTAITEYDVSLGVIAARLHVGKPV